MAERVKCAHCGGSGTCNKVYNNASCEACCKAAGLDPKIKGYAPCSVCSGRGTVCVKCGRGSCSCS